MQQLKIKIPDKTIEIPYLKITGNKKGKTCIISGGMHGDELNGIMLVKKFLDYCKLKNIEEELMGEIIVLPILNKSGFMKQRRHVVYDNRDLNRAFNRKSKSVSNLIANALEKKFYSKADLAIDCHDSGKRSILIPHPRIHKFESKYCTSCTREIAKAMGFKIVIERGGKAGMLAVEMTKKYAIPTVTLEMGGALKIDYKYLDESLNGIINVLKFYKMLPGEVKFPKKQYFLRHRFGVPSNECGIISFSKKLGQRIHRGDKIGSLYVPTRNKVVDLISPMCGIIFSIQHVDSVADGEIMYSILEDRECHLKRRKTMAMVEEVRNINM